MFSIVQLYLFVGRYARLNLNFIISTTTTTVAEIQWMERNETHVCHIIHLKSQKKNETKLIFVYCNNRNEIVDIFFQLLFRRFFFGPTGIPLHFFLFHSWRYASVVVRWNNTNCYTQKLKNNTLFCFSFHLKLQSTVIHSFQNVLSSGCVQIKYLLISTELGEIVVFFWFVLVFSTEIDIWAWKRTKHSESIE